MAVKWDLPLRNSPGPVDVEELAADTVHFTTPHRLPTPETHEVPVVHFSHGLLTLDLCTRACPARGRLGIVCTSDAGFIVVVAWP